VPENYPVVDLEDKKAEILVVHCSDKRFQKVFRHMIDELDKRYDLVAMAGGSEAIVQDDDVVDVIEMLHGLHQFEEVHMMNHINCGRFPKNDNELEAHTASFNGAKARVLGRIPNLAFFGYLAQQDHYDKVEL